MPPITNDGTNSYIDHELSVNLDSTEAFEGPEKLLEIWFYPSDDSLPSDKSLRSISHDNWSRLLDLVNCKILSIKSSEKLDAFLLSESSLFVYDHKLILKTCGTTTTLFCLPALFELLKHDLGWDFTIKQPLKVFYSRRAFMFPQKQRSIHKNWQDEVDYLNQYFKGNHYLIGRIDDHWHLYVGGEQDQMDVIDQTMKIDGEDKDETFEILMTHLDPHQSEQFVTSRKPGFQIDNSQDLGHFLGSSTSNNTGLNNLYDNVGIHDSFSFTPCGYSSNTILDDAYYTLHVTPEADWSYASFESNVDPTRHGLTNVDIMNKVLKVFKPKRFQMTLFTKHESELFQLNRLGDYKKLDKVVYDLNGYSLLYMSYQLDDDLINELYIS
jgi:S-adenosylmethionine decarboxylase